MHGELVGAPGRMWGHSLVLCQMLPFFFVLIILRKGGHQFQLLDGSQNFRER